MLYYKMLIREPICGYIDTKVITERMNRESVLISDSIRFVAINIHCRTQHFRLFSWTQPAVHLSSLYCSAWCTWCTWCTMIINVLNVFLVVILWMWRKTALKKKTYILETMYISRVKIGNKFKILRNCYFTN